jgi:hypothetical protein
MRVRAAGPGIVVFERVEAGRPSLPPDQPPLGLEPPTRS